MYDNRKQQGEAEKYRITEKCLRFVQTYYRLYDMIKEQGEQQQPQPSPLQLQMRIR